MSIKMSIDRRAAPLGPSVLQGEACASRRVSLQADHGCLWSRIPCCFRVPACLIEVRWMTAAAAVNLIAPFSSDK
jgi:hypothetical protein